MKFQKKLDAIIDQNNSLVCVGLDSDFKKIPAIFHKKRYPLFEFNKAIIDSTCDLVCAYKPNSAFYEAEGERGIKQLKMTCDYLRKNYPAIIIILDAKRADIGSSNQGYIKYAFDYLGVDAMTVHPYLGRDAIQPFLDQKDKGIIILCKTSNPGANELQNLLLIDQQLPTYDGRIKVVPLFFYQYLAKKIVKDWNKNNNCMLVVGATYPEELKRVRHIVGEMTLLVPGIGAQGGDIEKTVWAGLNSKKKGMIINSSRGIIFASKNSDFAQRAREETKKLRELINTYR